MPERTASQRKCERKRGKKGSRDGKMKRTRTRRDRISGVNQTERLAIRGFIALMDARQRSENLEKLQGSPKNGRFLGTGNKHDRERSGGIQGNRPPSGSQGRTIDNQRQRKRPSRPNVYKLCSFFVIFFSIY